MKPELITALDVPNKTALLSAIMRLPDELSWYKVGLELFCAAGPEILVPLRQREKKIFLDLKLHDIPRTVEKAVTSLLQHDVQLVSLHAFGGSEMIKAAVHAAEFSNAQRPLKLLAVTVLTSLDQNNLHTLGINRTLSDQAVALAEMAYSCGVQGVVCSIHEAASIRKALGPDALIVTPGIRLPENDAGDQKRIGTPRDAMKAGATHLVIGRPFLEARDPLAAYHAVMNDLCG